MRLNLLALLCALSLAACSGANRGDAKAPETDPWADYKGTYATSASPTGTSSSPSKVAKNDESAAKVAQADSVKDPSPSDVADSAPAPPPASAAKKPKKTSGKAVAKKPKKKSN